MDNEELDDMEEEEEEEELDPENPDHYFRILERAYNKTVAELEQNPAAAAYAEEFTRLFEALYDTNEKRKELEENVKDLDDQVIDANDKLEIAQRLSDMDAATIAQLKSKIDYAYKLADAAHAREQLAQEIIENLRNQIKDLSQELDFKNKMGGEEEGGVQAAKNEEGLQRERDKLIVEVGQLQQKLVNALGYQEELERKNSQADVRINEINMQLEEQITELIKTRKDRDSMEDDVKDLTSEIMKLNRDIIQYENTIQKDERVKLKLERHLEEQKKQKEAVNKDLQALSDKHGKLKDDFASLRESNEETKKILIKKTLEARLREDEAVKLRTDLAKFDKLRDSYDKKLTKMEYEKFNILEDRDKLRQMYCNMEKELNYYKKQNELDKRTMDGMNRERDILNKNILRHQAVVRDHIKLIKIQEQTRKKLEAEIEEYIVEGGKQTKLLNCLEKERDRILDEQLDLTQKIEDAMDDMKLKKAEIYDLKKNIAEKDTKLRMQQNLFEGVRAERNGLQKLLQESVSECGELKTKLKVSSHQSEQLKEDIAMKEQELVKEETVLRKMTKEKDNLRIELDNSLENNKQLKGTIAEMKDEEKRLWKVITAHEKKIRQQAKDLEQLMNERDILGSQLVRRNDELGLLYEKIKILQLTLQRGEAHYERRLEDIRLLKVEVKRLRQEKILLTKSVTNMTDLRQEVFHLERDLMRERLKCRALEEEVQNPLNVHRWRKLEGSDPSMLELLKKVQILQKRLLQQASDALDRERQLKESEKMYLNLRQILARQPGPDVQNELIKTRKALIVRGNKLKCLVSELNMTEQQASEYKSDLDKVKEELKLLKNKYMVEKKAQQRHLEAIKNSEAGGGEMCPGRDCQGNQFGKFFKGGGFKR